MRGEVLKYSIFMILIFLLIACGQQDAALEVPNDDEKIRDMSKISFEGMELIANWDFDQENVNDNSGHTRHGILINPHLASFEEGVEGQALRINGSGKNDDKGSWVSIPFIDFNEFEEFGMEMWMKNEDMSYMNGQMMLFFGDVTYGWLGLGHHTRFPNPADIPAYHFSVGTHMNDIFGYSFLTGLESEEIPFGNNEWKRISMVYLNGTVYGYIDGKLIGSDEQIINVHGMNAAIGKHWWSNGEQSCVRYTGLIDEVKIYAKFKLSDNL